MNRRQFLAGLVATAKIAAVRVSLPYTPEGALGPYWVLRDIDGSELACPGYRRAMAVLQIAEVRGDIELWADDFVLPALGPSLAIQSMELWSGDDPVLAEVVPEGGLLGVWQIGPICPNGGDFHITFNGPGMSLRST